jgi:hypothetical protein
MFGWKTYTDNGKYWISTSNLENVGTGLGFEHLLDFKYETMVFPIIDGEPDYGADVDCLRSNDEDEAYLNHLKMFEKYNNL